jgi:hypothetical protein
VRFRVLLFATLLLAPSVRGEEIALGSQSAATAESSATGISFPAQQSLSEALRALFSTGTSLLTQIGPEKFALLQRFYAAHGYARSG